MLPCVSTAPLATPVVPPVYCRKAMSSWCKGSSRRRCARPVRKAALNSMAPSIFQGGTIFFTYLTTALVSNSFSTGSRSPTSVVITCKRSAGLRSITACTVWAKFSSTTRVVAPESLSWCSNSGTVYCGFTLTTTSPARSTPNRATGYCSTLGIISATRSPRCKPSDCCKNAPNSPLARSSSA